GSGVVSRTHPCFAGLAGPPIGTGQMWTQGGRGRALRVGLDGRTVWVPALRAAPSLSSADRVCRLAAAPRIDAPRGAARGGGDRGYLQQPRPCLSFPVAAGLRLPGTGALAVSGDASGDRARSRLVRLSRPLGGAADRQTPSTRQRVDRLGRYHRLSRRRARD